MSEVFDWATTSSPGTDAASNGGTPPDGFPEGMNYSQVNNSAREVMAAIARDIADTRGVLETIGTAPNYEIPSSNRTITAYTNGLAFAFRCHANNVGAASTLNVNAIGAAGIFAPDNSNPTLYAGGIYVVVYSAGAWRIVSCLGQGPQLPALIPVNFSRNLDPTDVFNLLQPANTITLSVLTGGFNAGETVEILYESAVGGFTLLNLSGGFIFSPNLNTVGISNGGSLNLNTGYWKLIKLSGFDWLLVEA